jgi:hypothetical protein
MIKESAHVFLNKMKDKIASGEFDKEVGPFMSKATIYASIKARVDKKLETGGTPLLSDAEVKDALKDAKEVAAITLGIFSKLGFFEKSEGEWKPTRLGEKLISSLKPY